MVRRDECRCDGSGGNVGMVGSFRETAYTRISLLATTLDRGWVREGRSVHLNP